jgi:hypothetical protein
MLSCANFEVKFIMRQVKLVAHTLTRTTNFWTSFHIFEINPSCIELLVINEMQHHWDQITTNVKIETKKLNYKGETFLWAEIISDDFIL